MECEDPVGWWMCHQCAYLFISPSIYWTPSLCWVLSGQCDVVVNMKTALPCGAEVLRKEHGCKEMSRYLQSLWQCNRGVRTVKWGGYDPICEVQEGLITQAPRLSRKDVLECSVYTSSHPGWSYPDFIKGKLRPRDVMALGKDHKQQALLIRFFWSRSRLSIGCSFMFWKCFLIFS